MSDDLSVVTIPDFMEARTLAPKLADTLVALGEKGRITADDERALTAALVRDATDAGASDIHLEVWGEGLRVRFRIDGELLDVGWMTDEQGLRLTNQLKALGEIDPVALFAPREARKSYNLDGEEIDLRIAVAPCVGGQKMVIRLLNVQRVKQHIGELGLQTDDREAIERWLAERSGMFLVTGPTGSGKTTTLYALLHELRLANKAVVTIEDPAEYAIEGIAQLQVDEKRGLTFAEGLKAMMRMDPDYLLVGEIRDRRSARAGADASVRGHVLMSTLHSRDPFGAVTALRNWGVLDHEIAATLSVVVGQRLVRKLCPACRRLEPPREDERQWLIAMGAPVPELVWHDVGCERCLGIGFRGRCGIFELWRLTEADSHLIVRRADEQTLRRSVRQRGGTTLLVDGLTKAASGVTTIGALRAIPDLAPLQGTPSSAGAGLVEAVSDC